MPKRAKKAWRKNINLDDLYEGIQRTRQELATGGIIREKTDAELFSIDDVGAPTEDVAEGIDVEPPKKRRKPLKVDEILGTTGTKLSIPSHILKNKRQIATRPTKPVEEKKETYDVWNKVEVIPAPKDLPPPATLSYSKSVPAQAPATIRSTRRLLRPRDKVKAVTVASAGQSYNPTLEDWEETINRTALGEEQRLEKIAKKEWVPQPEEEVETPAPENDDTSEDEKETSETFLGKPVQVRRKTKAQRNKQAREAEQERLRKLAQTLKSKRKQLANLPTILSQISKHRVPSVRQKKLKELPVAPLEVQLSDELAESLRLLKPEGNLFRDRYRSLVERGIVEPRFAPNRRGRRYPVKYVEKYDYKHWGKYYGK